MPPKRQFSGDQIIEVAFDIAKEEGLDGLTIRKIAQQLGSSVAPIYVNFENLEELKQAIVQKTFALSRELMEKEESGDRFLDIGIASLRFAQDYPALYRDLVLRPSHHLKEYDQELGDPVLQEMEADPALARLSSPQRMEVLLKLRIFQTGLSVLLANGVIPGLGMDEAIELLKNTGEDIVNSALSRVNEV